MSRDLDEDEFDEEDDDIDETYPCPHCGHDVYVDAEWCPRCENYLSEEDAPATSFPPWVKMTAALLLTLFILGYWVI